MRMEHLKSQRPCFSGRTLLLIAALVVFSMNARGYDVGIDEEINEELVKDVAYDYELFERASDMLDCKGTLHVSLSLPDDIDRVILYRTIPRDRHKDNPMFLLLADYPGDTTEIMTQEVYWGTYFCVRVLYTDGRDEHSPTYAVNDYVDEQDLELLRQQASVEDMEAESVRMYVEGRTLYVDPAGRLALSVFDPCGRRIFSGNIEQPQSVPLGTICSPMIIVNCTDTHRSVTKKLLVK